MGTGTRFLLKMNKKSAFPFTGPVYIHAQLANNRGTAELLLNPIITMLMAMRMASHRVMLLRNCCFQANFTTLLQPSTTSVPAGTAPQKFFLMIKNAKNGS